MTYFLKDNDIERLLGIPATITTEEFGELVDSEGADRDAYFELLEEKYGKGWKPGQPRKD